MYIDVILYQQANVSPTIALDIILIIASNDDDSSVDSTSFQDPSPALLALLSAWAVSSPQASDHYDYRLDEGRTSMR